MNARLETLRLWWGGRSLREQRLLMFMGGLLAVVLLWFAVITPALSWRTGSTERRAEAAADLALIEAGTTRVTAGSSTLSISEIETTARRAADAGGVNAVLNPADGGLGFSINGATTATLFGWLATLQAGGVDARELTVSENADATLNAEGLLVGPPAP